MAAPRIRVLLADPEQQVSSACRQFLEPQGFEVATASNREECWSKLTEWKPDVLVLEPETPDRWGEEVLLRLSQPDERRVPVLILTKRDSEPVNHPIRESHVKPISMHELVRSIHAAVADGRRDEPPETDLLVDKEKHQPGGA